MSDYPRWWIGGLLFIVVLGFIWLAPLPSDLVLLREADARVEQAALTYPQFEVGGPDTNGQTTISIIDDQSWAHVKLTVDGTTASFLEWEEIVPGQRWRWRWQTEIASGEDGPRLAFYRDCDTGCQLRGLLDLGQETEPEETGIPTKLCVVFADPTRHWHGRMGWVVDMTYMTLADDEVDRYWGVDALAARVAQAERLGLRVLVRIEYDRNQTLPPAEDYLALTDYLGYVRRLARDARLQSVYGYMIGSGMNASDANQQGMQPLDPEWVARLINGAGEPPDHTDNVIAIVRAEHPTARILVGPVRPWNGDQNPQPAFALDQPWLNYFNALAAALADGINEKAAAGIGLGRPDGFALHAPGRPDAVELGDTPPAHEPQTPLPRPSWNGAQAGFQLYQDWLAVIDSHATLQGLPVYITATNTFAPDYPQDDASTPAEPPAQNYPQGWLTSAYTVVNQDPRVQALCWFLDLVPGDDRWDAYSLSRENGRLLYAAEEFDALLQRPLQPDE